ncbi:GNAT family N-acetyltransferase [Burkholderia sp. Ac-20349]|uniref:GNAT family N-acetyltransferase n=1 Tax=Burkholderia sp. Ac-20349 TaxID=2703893 RepID=UPI00197C0023|nr:GNAT family N-acetyltransferase [Burkholderia sp. Ac-20349]MBN3844488.1 GNAT family N-acetyltransferase [Burkholderia sp. Ac-20349]
MTDREPDFRIAHLADHPWLIPDVAQSQQREFGHFGAVSIDERMRRLGSALNTNRLPVSLVALDTSGTLLGSASLLAQTITHPHLTPWLSTMVVAPRHRRRGIASALALRAQAEAATMGFRVLHLFTERSEALYARLGWARIDDATVAGRPVVVMRACVSSFSG